MLSTLIVKCILLIHKNKHKVGLKVFIEVNCSEREGQININSIMDGCIKTLSALATSQAEKRDKYLYIVNL